MDQTINAAILDHHLSLVPIVTKLILAQPTVKAAADAKQAAGVPIFQIMLVLLPFAVQYLTTGTIDWAAVVAAIQALLVPTAAPKAAPEVKK